MPTHYNNKRNQTKDNLLALRLANVELDLLSHDTYFVVALFIMFLKYYRDPRGYSKYLLVIVVVCGHDESPA